MRAGSFCDDGIVQYEVEPLDTLNAIDARLIAAAPQLYQALKFIVAMHKRTCQGEECHISGIDAAEAAIAKAEGRG